MAIPQQYLDAQEIVSLIERYKRTMLVIEEAQNTLLEISNQISLSSLYAQAVPPELQVDIDAKAKLYKPKVSAGAK